MTEKVKPNDWNFKDKIERIVDENIKEIPWEGTEVNKYGIIEGIIGLLSSKEYSLLKHTKSEKMHLGQ